MTQTRPRLDDDLAAEVKAYAKEWRISFNAAVTILLRSGLQSAAWPQPASTEIPLRRRPPAEARARMLEAGLPVDFVDAMIRKEKP
jgi:hypothetical protein